MTDAGWYAGRAPIGTRLVSEEQPWEWLSAGWRDLRRAPEVSLAYGALFSAISFVLTAGLYFADLLYLLLPLAAGFMFLGPLIAVGLYEVSRRLETGEPVTFRDAATAWRRHFPQIAGMGLILMLFMLVWIRLATLIFALFFSGTPASWEALINIVFFSLDGIPFLIVGTLVGGVLAALAFAVSAVSLPILLDRDIGVIRAIGLSLEATLRNWRVMIGWAGLIALFTAGGLATAYVGLIVTLPLVGHASWHAYRDLIGGATD
ncbi:MAG: hypothetical protein BroJett029_23490 [Alphaproteobacteria bacterium]|nr:MAG: hypothetical protein BroJett029_23490 [Alphaproteobacteria bacterium]